MSSGIFATPTLRNRSGPSSAGRAPQPAGPRLRGRPPDLADGPPRAWRAVVGGAAPARARRRLGGRSGRVCGHGGAPAGAGAFGSAFEVFQDVRQVCGVVAAEILEEVDFDVHRGFLSLFPLCRTSILPTATPRVKPQRCVLRHNPGHRKLPNGKTKGSPLHLPTRNLPGRILR